MAWIDRISTETVGRVILIAKGCFVLGGFIFMVLLLSGALGEGK